MIKILASGSSGNCYFLETEPNILIEAGVPLDKVRQAVRFKTSSIAACLVSHSHGDHSKYIKDYLKFGIKCYMTPETQAELSIKHPLIENIHPLTRKKIGSSIVTPFLVKHDTDAPIGFVVESGNEKILYSGDTAFIKYKFKGLTRIMIECNWYEEAEIDTQQRKRLLQTHMNLTQVREFLKKNDLTATKEILLLHISKHNGYPEHFKRVIQEDTGKLVRYK